jgi:hypothetical protein
MIDAVSLHNGRMTIEIICMQWRVLYVPVVSANAPFTVSRVQLIIGYLCVGLRATMNVE